MELNLKKDAVAACELLADSAAEQTIECDVLLPDYCPDIVRVLCCSIDAAVTDCRINKTTFTVEGTAAVEICYMAEVGGVKRCCYNLPFSKNFELKSQPQRPIWSVNVRQGHTNCRAVSKRRLDVRGAVVISAKVYETAGKAAVCDAQGMGIQLCRRERDAVEVVRQIQRQITVAEAVTAVGSAEPTEIISVRCTPTNFEARVMASRILLKGEVAVHLLYKTDPDSGALETADYILPISQVIDEDGLNDDMRCGVSVRCLSAECRTDDYDGDGQLRLELRLAADVRLFKPIKLVGVTDSFSTLYPTENSMTEMRVPTGFSPILQRETVKEGIEAPHGTAAMTDVRADIVEYAAENSAGKIDISAKIKFVGIISTEDTAADTFSHVCDCRMSIPVMWDSAELLITPEIVNAYGRLGGDMIELGCEMMISGTAIEWEKQAFITDVTVDESVPRVCDPSLGFIIYYAEEGERVWDIAKRYGSFVHKIMEDNSLKSEVIDKAMPIMIPTV